MRSYPFALVLLTAASVATAQNPLLQVQTESPGPALVGPDLDGDGIRDLFVGDPGGYPVPPRPGLVQAFSGADGAPLWTFDGEVAEDSFGSALALVGDLDGDDVVDLAIGAPGETPDSAHRPYVQVVSARSGNVILRVEGPAWLSAYGSDLEALGDVDGDGVPDLAVAAAGNAPYGLPPEEGFVEVVSGASAAALWRSAATSPGGHPVALARLVDQDGDGGSELAAGFASLERVEVLAGATGAVLRTLTPPAGAGFGGGTAFGAAVDSCADVDGDDVEDLLVGAPYELIEYFGGGGYEGYLYHGSLYAISGRTGDPLHRTTAVIGQSGFGTSVAALGDFDGDGTDDYVTGNVLSRTGCCNYHPGAASVYSQRSGAILLQGPIGSGGLYADAGDWNGDGLADYLVSAVPPQYPETVYTTWIVPGQWPQAVTNAACAGTPAGCTPVVYSSGGSSPHSQEPFGLHAWGFEAGARGLLILGSGEDFTPFASGALCVARPFARLPADVWRGGPTFACYGGLSRTLDPGQFGHGALSVGATVHGQFVSRDDSGAVGLSEGAAFTVLP